MAGRCLSWVASSLAVMASIGLGPAAAQPAAQRNWDEGNRLVTIEFVHDLSMVLRDVRVVDYISSFFDADRGRFGQISPQQGFSLNRIQPYSVDWVVDQLGPLERHEFAYPIKENITATVGAIPISGLADDRGPSISWLYQELILSIPVGTAEYQQLDADVGSGLPVSAATANFIDGALQNWLASPEPVGPVQAMPTHLLALVQDGFDWEMVVPELEFEHLLVMPLGGNFTGVDTLATGKILIRSTVSGYELFGEFQGRVDLSATTTKSSFVPLP